MVAHFENISLQKAAESLHHRFGALLQIAGEQKRTLAVHNFHHYRTVVYFRTVEIVWLFKRAVRMQHIYPRIGINPYALAAFQPTDRNGLFRRLFQKRSVNLCVHPIGRKQQGVHFYFLQDGQKPADMVAVSVRAQQVVNMINPIVTQHRQQKVLCGIQAGTFFTAVDHQHLAVGELHDRGVALPHIRKDQAHVAGDGMNQQSKQKQESHPAG